MRIRLARYTGCYLLSNERAYAKSETRTTRWWRRKMVRERKKVIRRSRSLDVYTLLLVHQNGDEIIDVTLAHLNICERRSIVWKKSEKKKGGEEQFDVDALMMWWVLLSLSAICKRHKMTRITVRLRSAVAGLTAMVDEESACVCDVFLHIYLYIYIHIATEGEREKKKERKKGEKQNRRLFDLMWMVRGRKQPLGPLSHLTKIESRKGREQEQERKRKRAVSSFSFRW